MAIETLQAWVLHKQWSGDSSARVSFFTRELGLLPCFCKGGRAPKKQSLLQAFTPLWLNVNKRYDRYFSHSMESVSPMLSLEGHALFSGLYINELLYYTLSPFSPDEELFNAYIMTLNGLALTSDRLLIESSLRRFEWVLLKVCGHSFSLTQEAGTGTPIEADRFYQFIPGEGFLLAHKGIAGNHLLRLAEDNLTEAASLKAAKIIMRQAIHYLLDGKELKARSLYDA